MDVKKIKLQENFYPDFQVLSSIGSDLDKEDIIKNEPMLWSATLGFALDNGGPLTRAFISELLKIPFVSEYKSYTDLIIDSRVNMLMEGWYPSIPGWHLDHIERGGDGQPKIDGTARKVINFCMIVGECSRTEFLLPAAYPYPYMNASQLRLDVPPFEGGNLYKHYNDAINNALESTAKVWYDVHRIDSGDIVMFSNDDWHRATPATKSGWRFFIRGSLSTKRKFYNEIRNQVQVYLPTIDMGW